MPHEKEIHISSYDRDIVTFSYKDKCYYLSVNPDEIIDSIKSQDFEDVVWERDVCSYHIIDYIIKHWDNKQSDGYK
jgi:hypothetical protein